MKIEKFSKKQGEVLKFAFEKSSTLICDGSVRSGKTVVMTIGFVIWAMDNFCNTNFAICGKTVSNAERNILKPFQQIEGLPYTLSYKIAYRCLTVRCGERENYFYLFGGKDESSYMLIQGLTLAGVLFDEVALMPRSFVDQAIARTLSFANAKIWFNCNPESPNHWFYKEWITNEKRDKKHLHFLMKDNPILGAEEIKKAEAMFTGVFYKRYILGEWTTADGIIFDTFAMDPCKYLVDEVPPLRWLENGFDIGGNGSAYALTSSGQGVDGVIYVLKSKKKQAQDLRMDDVEAFVDTFCQSIVNKYNRAIECVNCDHQDAIINTLNANTPWRCDKTYKPPREDRPFIISKLLASGKLKFVRGECHDLIDELCNLVYDNKSDLTVPLDDGTMQIDTYDSFVYSLAGNWHYLID